MIAVFDTSSLHALCKYYLPLDRNGNILQLIEQKCISKEIVVIDQVINEARTLSGGIILSMIGFLNNRIHLTHTNNILPTQDFFHNLNNSFVNQSVVAAKNLTSIKIQNAKHQYTRVADGRLLIYAQSILSLNPVIITEESRLLNDGKTIKKIPINCDSLGLQSCTLPILFKDHYQLTISC